MLEQRIQQQFFEGADLQYQTAEALARPIAEAVGSIVGALTAGGKLLLCGQGGGALLARHAADLLVGQLERDRPPLAAASVAAQPRSIQALGLPGDLLLLIDPTGEDLDASMAAVRAAQGKDMTVVLLVGTSGAGLRETLERDHADDRSAHPSAMVPSRPAGKRRLRAAGDPRLARRTPSGAPRRAVRGWHRVDLCPVP